MNTPFIVELKPSISLAILSSLSHVLAFISLWILPLDIYLKLLISLIIVWSEYRLVLAALHRQADSIIKLEYRAFYKDWIIHCKNGQTEVVQVMADTVVTAFCVCLHLKSANRPWHLVIFSWELKPDLYRLLIRTLRIQKSR